MTERILVCAAWPYANGPLHLGHIAGCYLPADIFARFHRLKGNQVLMVSGSDQHGTPITLRAEQEGTSPQVVVERFHEDFLKSWEKLGISFDLFTTTGTKNHESTVHDIFLRLLERGYIYKDSMPQAYCVSCQRFLPDRYIEGKCPHCGFQGARGDQCDGCGKPLNAIELIDLRCRLCAATPRFESSEHYFLKLSAFEDRLKEWVGGQVHWRENVRNFTLGFLQEGLRDRAITRDIDWGVTVPAPGFGKKRIYVWFEAVIGYLSACREWAQTKGEPEAWKDYWQGDVKAYYFIGKDNIPFHTIIWPAMLMGFGDLNLPFDVPANEFLTIEGKKLSTSRNWAVWVPDFLSRYAPDPLRYLLSVNMPETGDADFSWKEFVRRNNDELVATYGNLAHRTLTFIQRNYGGMVPPGGEPDAESRELMVKAGKTIEDVAISLSARHFKEAIKIAMALAHDANRYLDYRAPWKKYKEDKVEAGKTLYNALYTLSALKTVLFPFLPASSEKLNSLLGFNKSVADSGWRLIPPEPGSKLPVPEPLFTKLEEKVAEEESARLGT